MRFLGAGVTGSCELSWVLLQEQQVLFTESLLQPPPAHLNKCSTPTSSASSAPISLVTCSKVFDVGVPSCEKKLNFCYLFSTSQLARFSSHSRIAGTLLLACSHHVATKLFSTEICLVKENCIPSSPHLGISAQKTRVKNLVISRVENNALDIHEYTCIFMPTNLT